MITVSLLFLVGATAIILLTGVLAGILIESHRNKTMLDELIPTSFAAGYKLGSDGIDKTLSDMGVQVSSPLPKKNL